jgi:hypothetical protein
LLLLCLPRSASLLLLAAVGVAAKVLGMRSSSDLWHLRLLLQLLQQRHSSLPLQVVEEVEEALHMQAALALLTLPLLLLLL